MIVMVGLTRGGGGSLTFPSQEANAHQAATCIPQIAQEQGGAEPPRKNMRKPSHAIFCQAEWGRIPRRGARGVRRSTLASMLQVL